MVSEVEREPPPVLLCDTVAQWVEEILGQVVTDGEFDKEEVWHPDTEGVLEVLSDSVIQLDTVAE